MTDTEDLSHLYALLACPRCGVSPRKGRTVCSGCGRSIEAPSGALDLLDDGARPAADQFAASYRALRTKEGWADSSGREEPGTSPIAQWKHRRDAVAQAAAILARGWAPGTRPVVADVGSGGGWATSLLDGADVIAIDLSDASPTPASLTVRADMTRLPIRDGCVDGALYAASLHYAPIERVVREAARILRPGGRLVAVESPVYQGHRAQAMAAARSEAYYARSGFPQLAAHYHPIEEGELKSALAGCGFAVEILDPGRSRTLWSRLSRRPPSSIVVARRRALT